MLRIGLTGGIGSGKSTVARLLEARGAVVADADAIAREVVAPGTPGLAQVDERFPGVVRDGALDRAALAAVVFADPGERRALEAITHPLIGAQTARLAQGLLAGGVFVHDVPLLVELDMAPAYALVVVVEAPLDLRLERLEARGLPPADARVRIGQQAGVERRREVADVLLDNGGDGAALEAQVESLWSQRLAPFARYAAARTAAPRGPAVIVGPDPTWPAQAKRVAARVARVTGGLPVWHIGSTAVPGLAAKDVLDLQAAVPDMAAADALAGALAEVGWPAIPAIRGDNPHPVASDPDPAHWAKRFHSSADPGRPVNLHLRVAGSPGWSFALLFRDWLRDQPAEVAAYEGEKRRLAGLHAGDPDSEGYAEAKEPWFAAAFARARTWAADTAWAPGPPDA